MTGSIVFYTVIAAAFGLLWLGLIGTLFWWQDRLDGAPIATAGAAYIWGWTAAVPAVRGLMAAGKAAADAPGSSLFSPTAAFQPATLIFSVACVLCAVWVARGRFDLPIDAMILGTAVGLGHGGATVALDQSSTLGPWFALFFGVARDAATGAALGAVFGWASTLRGIGSRIAAIALGMIGTWGFGVATGMVDRPTVILRLRLESALLTQVILLVMVIGTFTLIAAVVLRFESKVLAAELASEHLLGTVPEWAPQVIPSFWKRLRGDWWPSRRERVVVSSLLSRLAFRRRIVAGAGADEGQLGGLEIVRLRQRIRYVLAPSEDPSAGTSANRSTGVRTSLRTLDRCGKHDVKDAPRHHER